MSDQIGDEAFADRVVAGNDDGVLDAALRQQGGFDLARLDAEAADLHLGIEAAEEFELAIGAPAHPVAGAVEPLAGGERVGHEPLGGEAGAGEI
jgi:hypothetical protein